MSRWRQLRLVPVAALLAIVLAGAASAQQEQAPPASAPTPPAPAPPPAVEAIPIPEIASRADEARSALRAIEQQSALGAEAKLIAKEFAAGQERRGARSADARRVLAGRPTLAALTELALDWRATAADLGQKRAVLTRHAQIAEDQLDAVVALRERWEETRRKALEQSAPPAVVQAIDGVLAAIRDTRRLVRDERSTALTLQNEIAQAELAVAELLDPIDREIERQRQSLFEPDAPPLWAITIPDEPLGERVQTTLARRGMTLREWMLRERPRFVAQFGIAAAALALLLGLRRSGSASGAEPGSATALIFARPISAAAVVGLWATLWLHEGIPAAARSLLGLVTIPVLWRLLPGLLGAGLQPVILGLAVLFLVGQLRGLAESLPVVERVLFSLQTLGAMTFALWAMRVVRAGQARVRPAWRRPIEYALRLAIALLGTSFLADTFGYLDLATLLTTGVLVPAYMAVAIFAVVRIADEVVAALLRTAATLSVRMATTHADVLRERGRVLTRIVAVAFWIWEALDSFALHGPVLGALGAVLSASLEVGTVKLSLGDLVAFGVTVTAAFSLSALLRFVLEEDVYPRLPLARGVPNAVSTFLHYALLFFGFTLALAAAGLDLGRFSLLAGAFGVGIGFGLQNVVNNFVSGLILLFERPVNVGDAIQLTDVSGEVRRIGVRSSTIRTWEGADVIVPNANLISERVVNWTLSDRRRRIDLAVSVDYGTEPERVQTLLVDVARKHPDVLSAPPPVALFLGFGENALNFELRAWVENYDLSAATRSDIAIAVYAALQEAGIEIPYPHRDVTVRMAPPG